MATRTTRWRPDTCTCILEYQWNDATAPGQQTYTGSAVIYKCPSHSAIPDNMLYTSLKFENAQKNLIINTVKETMGMSDNDVMLGKISYTFDETRKMEVQVLGLTTLKKTQTQTALVVNGLIDLTANGILKTLVSK